MQNKTGKYIKYAIGEIVLVVIGILIALQINNWNEQKKSDSLYYSYLLRLKDDFTSIHISTSEALDIEEGLLDLGELLMDFNLNKKEDVNNINLAIAVDYTSGRHYYNKISQTWADLVSTGNLKLIENKQLKNEIGAYNNLADQRNFQIEEWFRFKEQYRDLTRHILKPEERLLIPDNWPRINIEDSGFDDLKSIFTSTSEEIKFKLQAIPELNGVLSDVIITRKITTNMMDEEITRLDNILDILMSEISKFK